MLPNRLNWFKKIPPTPRRHRWSRPAGHKKAPHEEGLEPFLRFTYDNVNSGEKFMCQARDRRAILDEHELKALLMVQGIIARMADNSQKCKTFFLTLCAAVTTLAGACGMNFSGKIAWLFLVLTMAFWYLDARYLQLERKFRQHHKAIIGGTVPYLDQWDIDLNRYNAGFGSCLISFSEWLYPVTGATILIIVLA